MQNKNNINNILSNLIYQLVVGIVFGYGIFFLTNKGLSATMAGFSLSLLNLISIFIQSYTSNFLDNSEKYDVFDAAVIFSTVTLLLFIVMAILPKIDILICIFFALAVGVCVSNEPIIYSFAMYMNAKGIEVDFGKARAYGSFGYGLICAVFGFLTNKYSANVVTYGLILFTLIQTIILLITRKDYRAINVKPIVKEKQESISYREFLKNNTYFLILCIFLVGLFFGYIGVDNFMINVTEDVGGTSQDMGIILAVKAALEFGMIYFYSKIRKKVGLKTILIVTAIGFVLKSVAIVLSKSVLDLYLTQILQMFGFALIIPSMVEYVELNLNPREVNRGQAFFTMSTLVAGTLVNYTLGLIINARGVKAMEIFSMVVSIVSALGFICTLLFKKINE